MPKSKIYLPDVNVWLAYTVDTHVFHSRSKHWLDNLVSEEAVFCRITQMGLLRLLTNSRVMHAAVLTQRQAWLVYRRLLREGRVRFLAEPSDLEGRWGELMQKACPSNELWTDCYLQAFAEKWGLTVATFDKKFAGGGHSGVLVLS